MDFLASVVGLILGWAGRGVYDRFLSNRSRKWARG